MFDAIIQKTRSIQGLTIRDLYRQLFLDKEFTDLIIRLNTEGEQTSQLIYGVNSKDESLDDIGGEYSPYTKMLKSEKGQITDHVTLKDTGYFYRSFRCIWRADGDGSIQITADTIKEGGDDLIARWGKDIIGLDDDNVSILRDYAKEKILSLVYYQLKQAA